MVVFACAIGRCQCLDFCGVWRFLPVGLISLLCGHGSCAARFSSFEARDNYFEYAVVCNKERLFMCAQFSLPKSTEWRVGSVCAFVRPVSQLSGLLGQTRKTP